jgi:hypothetical protein
MLCLHSGIRLLPTVSLGLTELVPYDWSQLQDNVKCVRMDVKMGV